MRSGSRFGGSGLGLGRGARATSPGASATRWAMALVSPRSCSRIGALPRDPTRYRQRRRRGCRSERDAALARKEWFGGLAVDRHDPRAQVSDLEAKCNPARVDETEPDPLARINRQIEFVRAVDGDWRAGPNGRVSTPSPENTRATSRPTSARSLSSTIKVPASPCAACAGPAWYQNVPASGRVKW